MVHSCDRPWSITTWYYIWCGSFNMESTSCYELQQTYLNWRKSHKLVLCQDSYLNCSYFLLVSPVFIWTSPAPHKASIDFLVKLWLFYIWMVSAGRQNILDQSIEDGKMYVFHDILKFVFWFKFHCLFLMVQLTLIQCWLLQRLGILIGDKPLSESDLIKLQDAMWKL